MRLFGGDNRGSSSRERTLVQRPSSGWNVVLQTLREREGQRILDIGPTSANNINLLTTLGHSVYMANVVAESKDARWSPADEPFRVKDFLDETLAFSDRKFDTVLLWDTTDYLVTDLATEVVARLHDAMAPGAQMLSFFHVKPDDEAHRYHIREDSQLDVQQLPTMPVHAVMTNRQIEQMFASFTTYKFFLAKDNLREVVITR